ncbi:MAG TPA: SGNH/GDSL hydrolase family protein [Patescibacteria group bacterium]|nr:SGNH/GDSL hydrolase family protein [Patescibacteria group bacterium]
MRSLTGIVSLIVLCCFTGASAEVAAPSRASILKKGQRVAVVGDSITEQKLYSKFIELYLTACLPELDLHVIQLGWGGETAPGFAARMNNDLLPWKPDVVTTCYGMNDGSYRAYDESIGKRYALAMADIVARLKKAGATVVVGGPGVVDSKYFQGGGEKAKVYNDNLKHLSEHAKKIAETEGFPHADVFGAMMAAMEKAKPVLGEAYDVGGKDGVHPGPNGHLVMAYAFLKGMGIDGQIATITVDLKGAATASEGHKVLGSEAGKVELESSKYPFCFVGDEKSAAGTRSMLPYVPFNADLNRFTLVVKNLDGAKAKVTWGAASKTFAKEDLEKGINLAAEFAENPFAEPFRKLDAMVFAKQQLETGMIKSVINQFPRTVDAMGKDKAAEASVEALRKQMLETQEKLGASIRSAVVPVKHAIVVAVEK